MYKRQLQDYAPQTDVAIELGGEDAKIIYFTGGIDQRMNGICAGGTGSFIDQMVRSLLCRFFQPEAGLAVAEGSAGRFAEEGKRPEKV